MDDWFLAFVGMCLLLTVFAIGLTKIPLVTCEDDGGL